MNNNYGPGDPNYNPSIYNNNHSGSGFLWIVIGFAFPFIGLILFIVWKNTDPFKSKKVGIGALAGFIFEMLLPFIVFALFYIFGWNQIQESVVDQTCKTYGSEYKAELIDEHWYCINETTGEKIDAEGNIEEDELK